MITKKTLNVIWITAVLFLSSYNTIIAGHPYHTGKANPPATPYTRPAFEHYFGKVKSGRTVNYAFKWKNDSARPVVISNVITSCGCTTPQWSKKPVMPGKTINVTVGYIASAKGTFHKNITVQFADGTEQLLIIKGEVQ